MKGRALDDYPAGSALSESLLIHGYGGLGPSVDPVVSEGLAPRDLQPDQPSDPASEAEDAIYERWRDEQDGL